MDRPKLARALAKEMAKTGCRPACYVQVNTGEEPQKAGVLPAEADALSERERAPRDRKPLEAIAFGPGWEQGLELAG